MRCFKRVPHRDRTEVLPWREDAKFVETELKASDRQVGGGHYKEMVIQPSEFIHRNSLNWCEGSVIKYVCRHNLKGGRQDLEKAKHYIDLLLEWEYGSEDKSGA